MAAQNVGSGKMLGQVCSRRRENGRDAQCLRKASVEAGIVQYPADPAPF